MNNPTTIDVAAIETAAIKGAIRFVEVWVGAILSFWIGIGNVTVTGLGQDISNQWDSAAGVALLAALGAAGLGFLFGQSTSEGTKKLSAHL